MDAQRPFFHLSISEIAHPVIGTDCSCFGCAGCLCGTQSVSQMGLSSQHIVSVKLSFVISFRFHFSRTILISEMFVLCLCKSIISNYSSSLKCGKILEPQRTCNLRYSKFLQKINNLCSTVSSRLIELVHMRAQGWPEKVIESLNRILCRKPLCLDEC